MQPGEYTTASCRLCWIYHNEGPLGQQYRDLWAQQKTRPPASSAGDAHPGQGIDPASWPRLARWLARLRTPEDRGLGDTIARNLNRFGADAWKRLYTRITGADCGCQSRQEMLNSMFPYIKAESQGAKS